jgi:hypothetical protein
MVSQVCPDLPHSLRYRRTDAMEQENSHTAEPQPDHVTPTLTPVAVTADTIESLIATELAKVVDIDATLIEHYVAFLGTLSAHALDALLKALNARLGEQLLPLLEAMARSQQFAVAEAGILQLGKIHSFKAAQFLSALNESLSDKKLCKAARKSLYKLQSAGIEVETSQKPLLGEIKHTPYKAMVSAMDGTGAQLIMLSEEMLAGDLHLLQVVLNDEKGITEGFSRRGITKKMFAKLPETFGRGVKAGPMLVEVEYAYALSLIADAEAQNVLTQEDLPEEYTSMRAFFGCDQVAPGAANPIYSALNVGHLKESPHYLTASADLFKQQAFLSWLLPIKEMGTFTQELMDKEDSVLELSPQFKQEQKEEIYQKIIAAHFGEDAMKRLQRRLEIMAYLFFRQNDEESAKQALTAALAFTGMPSEALKTHPFLHTLITDSIEIARDVIEDGYDPEEFEREHYIVYRDDEGKLVVEPVEEEA